MKRKNAKNPDVLESTHKQDVVAESKRSILNYLSEFFPEKLKNMFIRTVLGIILFIGASVLLKIGGAMFVVLLIIGITFMSYHEIITIGHNQYKKLNLPWFRCLSWYSMASVSFFLYGESILQYLTSYGVFAKFLQTIRQFHMLGSFILILSGIIFFVLSLKKNYYKVQFILFAWYQLTMMILLIPSNLAIKNVNFGLIWFCLPVFQIITNDVFAYFCGFFFGKTQLIEVSPKKTWEGYIGGAFFTVIASIIICNLMLGSEFFLCPIQFDLNLGSFVHECKNIQQYAIKKTFDLPWFIVKLMNLLQITSQDNLKMVIYPIHIHGFVLSLFSSIIAPFGGFFASGFKRAFKIKDFADTIPGHGGFTDRFDCQFLMAVFVNVYLTTFVKNLQPMDILHLIYNLSDYDQLYIFDKLGASLKMRDLTN